MPCMVAAGGVGLGTAAAITSPPPSPPISRPFPLHRCYVCYPCRQRPLSSLSVSSSISNWPNNIKKNRSGVSDHQLHVHRYPFNLIISNASSPTSHLYSSNTPPSTPPRSVATHSAINLGCTEDQVDIDNCCGLVLIGINMATAPETMRKRLTFTTEEEYGFVIQQLHELPSIKEFFLLTTTHDQFELYVVVQPISSLSAAQEAIFTWLSRESRTPPSELSRHLFVHRDGKAARHLFEASVSDAIETGIDSMVKESLFSKYFLMGKKYGVCGVVLSRLLGKSFELQLSVNLDLSAETSIRSAVLAIARFELRGTKSSPNTLVVGATKSQCLPLAVELVCRLKIVGNFHKNEVAIVSHDYELEDDDDVRKECEAADITCRPMAQLLSCASKANLIFITSSSSETPMFSKTDIDGLSPIAHDEEGKCGRSRIFIDMCYPPNISFKSAITSARVFDIEDIFKVIHCKAADFRNEINREVEDFESRMENALVGHLDGTVSPQSQFTNYSVPTLALAKTLEDEVSDPF